MTRKPLSLFPIVFDKGRCFLSDFPSDMPDPLFVSFSEPVAENLSSYSPFPDRTPLFSLSDYI